MKVILDTDIKELKKIYKGKVRDLYEASNGNMLIVATDRISAFDVVFNEGIPEKGKMLNTISNFWFKYFKDVKSHIVNFNPEKEIKILNNYEGIPERSVLVKKVKKLPVECIVRGYLFGSVYDEYKKTKAVAGNPLPSDIPLAGKLDKPIFTPSTKAEHGHDENISVNQFLQIVGKDYGTKIIDISIYVYSKAAELLEKYGIILADTKFEFGIDENNDLILIDEILTPDSSRYWDKKYYKAGESPISYDKQFVRDYLINIKWDKNPPPPALPEDIINKTSEKYKQIVNILNEIKL